MNNFPSVTCECNAHMVIVHDSFYLKEIRGTYELAKILYDILDKNESSVDR